MTNPQTFLHSGEFHYFRVPKPIWKDRLSQMRDMGLNAVSIYIPWNWHEPQPGVLDLDGTSQPERDLWSALEVIGRSGLGCIFRPGPFITGEWRGGGIPDWLWERHPGALTRNVEGRTYGAERLYPALTYDHPIFRTSCAQWLRSLFGRSLDFLTSRGGPIMNVQIDDEPSYWHLLTTDPLAADYNPVLVKGNPSLYAAWCLERYGSLDRLNAAQGTCFRTAQQVEPPRTPMKGRKEFARYQDWLDFKLGRIDEYVAFLYDVLKECGVDCQISMLYPYLLPLQAKKFSDFACRRGMKIELTNECYLGLFTSTNCPEFKVGHVVSTHEAYHMWRGKDFGPAVTMELQGSNSAYLTSTAMNILYDVTVARGIQGINYYMLVGGENPPGYSHITGRDYDVSAVISPAGVERPHAAEIRRLARVMQACGPEILQAQPLRDVWLGCYLPYEAAAMVGGRSLMPEAAFAMQSLASFGDNGISDAPSLQTLLTLASVSFGCLDLEQATPDSLSQVRQLWVLSLDFLSRSVQETLLAYIQQGGHLVLLPRVPDKDEHMQACEILQRAIFGETPLPDNEDLFNLDRISLIETHQGISLVGRGKALAFELPPGAMLLAWGENDRRPCAFEQRIGDGRVSVLGFGLHYMPQASPRQKEFVAGIVEKAVGQRYASTTNTQMLAMQLGGQVGPQFICIVNPVDLPAATRVNYSLSDGQAASLPFVLDALEMPRQGARLLPAMLMLTENLYLHHTTWELVGREAGEHAGTLRFAAQPGSLGEVAFQGPLGQVHIRGGNIQSFTHLKDELHVLIIWAAQAEVILSFL